MGIRFLCPNGHRLNVKSELAGKRASCPECGAKLVIPAAANGESQAAVGTTTAPAAARSGAIGAATMTAAGWYLRTPAGEQFGPTTADEFRALIMAGRVTGDTPVWRDGWSAWKHAREVPDELPAPLAAVPISAAAVAAPQTSKTPRIEIPPIPEPPASSDLGSPIVVDPALVTTRVTVDRPQTVNEDGAEQLDEVSPALTDATSGSYAAQRQRNKRKQVTLAIAMLIAVVILAIVLVWVLTSNVGNEGGTPASTSHLFTSQESERT